MIIYLLKSGICLGVFLVFYKLFLENENMHIFKRFYLLGTTLAAFLIPLVIFTEYVEVTENVQNTILTIQETPIKNHTVRETTTTYVTEIIGTLYAIGVLAFGFIFFKNLFIIIQRIRKNPKYKSRNIIFVLLGQPTIPHTFFNYIFLNHQKFEAKEIPDAVLLHEETHAKQKHSIDLLMVELLQVVFWFNPLLIILKKSIKLNHEFLADQAVVNTGVPANMYQSLILAYSSHALSPKLANSIQYSSTRLTIFGKTFTLGPSVFGQVKKRISVMKTKTSNKTVLFKSLILLPLLAILLYSFAETKVILKKGTIANHNTTSYVPLSKTDDFKQGLNTESFSNRSVEIAGLVIDSESLLPMEKVKIYNSMGNLLSVSDEKGYFKVLFDDLNEGEIRFEFSLQKNNYKPLIQTEHWGNLSGHIKSAFYFGLQKKDSKSPELSELITNPSSLNYESILNNFYKVKTRFEFVKEVESIKKDNQLVLFEIDNSHFLINDSGWIKINSKEDLISINDTEIVPASQLNGLIERQIITGMTPLENNEALFAIYTLTEGKSNKRTNGASNKELLHFNALAKKYNTIPKENRIIPYEDLKTLEFIYNTMSEKQKENAQPFPEYPTSKRQESATKEQVAKYNALAKEYNAMIKKGTIWIKQSEVEDMNTIYSLMTDAQKAKAEPYPDFPEPPPTPTAPRAPNTIDYASIVIENIIEVQDPYDDSNLPTNVVMRKSYIPQPPAPPLPKSPLDHVIEMAKQGAIFYYEDKEITSDKAIDIIKKNSKINIKTQGSKLERPIVKISEVNIQTTIYNPEPSTPRASPSNSVNHKNLFIGPMIPPTPNPNPVEYIKELAEQGAIFYIGPHKYSSEEAIELVRKSSKEITIDVSQYPEVRLGGC